MSKKVKRKSRTKFGKELKITKPVTLEMLGTSEDPCFGLHLDPRSSECQRCGDSEFCAIAMAQKNNIIRNKIEKGLKFKDLEEEDIKPLADPTKVRKLVKKRIYELAKLGGNNGIKLEVLSIDIFSQYNHEGWTKKKVIDYTKKIADKFKKIKIQKDTVLWRQFTKGL